MSFAAERGHLEVLQVAREHHCPWQELTCYYAARGGHLAVLRWAVEQGCPWNKVMCAYGAIRHPETLAWVRAQP